MFGRRHSAPPVVLPFFIRLIVAVVLFILMIFAGRGAWEMYTRFTLASSEAERAQAELENLREREAEMAAAVEGLSSARGIEEEVRERYGVARPGEGKIDIVRNTATSGQGGEGEGGNMFLRILRSFIVW